MVKRPASEAFKAQHILILDDDQINVDGMDGLIEGIITAQSASVVDNGAASFLPMARYPMSNNIGSMLAEHHRRLVVHTVVVVASLHWIPWAAWLGC